MSKTKTHDGDSMDFDRLEKELNAAVEADQKYWRENDAKFRAVNQKVETYEEFRDIVKASHIKPLAKGDNFSNITFEQKWNVHAEKTKGKPATVTTEIKQSDKSVPKNGQEFDRDWRRYHKTTAERYNFLLQLGGEQIARIFKTEISFGLLGDFLNILSCEFCNKDINSILDILHGLGLAGRFSLSLQFLSSKEKQVCSQLFDKIQDACSDHTEADSGTFKTKLLSVKQTYAIKDHS